MTKINLYQMNFDPFTETSDSYIEQIEKEKSKIIKNVFRFYKNRKDEKAEMGEVYMHSFCPNDYSNSSMYIDFRIYEMKDPAILIASSLFDLGKSANKAVGRLSYALSHKKIKAIYFTDYSEVLDVEEYLEPLMKIFTQKGKLPNPRRVAVPDEIVDTIIKLRKYYPPTMTEDIAKYTGINPTTVRNMVGKEAYNVGEGDPITQKRIDYINNAFNEAKENEFKKFIIREEKFIK